MAYTITTILLYIIMIGASGCLGYTVFKILGMLPKVSLRDSIESSITDAIKSRNSLDNARRQLSKDGILYRLGDYNASPAKWVMIRILAGIVTGFIGFGLSNQIFVGAVCFPIGYFGLPMAYKHKGKSDMDDMMMDIYNTYSTLNIQLSSGLSVIDAMEYSYRMAQHKRYKEALAELVINMSDRTLTMSESIAIFKDRFDSTEINKMCAMIDNFSTYGVTEEYTKDIMEQINSLIMAATMKAEHDIESKAGLINFAFFAVIIFIVMFSVSRTFSGVNMF